MFTGPFVAIHCLFLLTAGGCASGIYIDIANYKCFLPLISHLIGLMQCGKVLKGIVTNGHLPFIASLFGIAILYLSTLAILSSTLTI